MGKAKQAKRRREQEAQVQPKPRPPALYFIISLLLAVSVLGIYGQTGGFEFVDFDDPVYVSANPHVRAGLSIDGIKWAMTAAHAQNWHPLTWLSHMLDFTLFGADPGRHHLTALALHAANSILLFLLLSWLTGSIRRSGFVAGLFALHPQHVESVAWISERKDVLSTLLLLLTILAYAWYSRKPGVLRYLPVMLFFALGLMAKPMLVTLPVLLLLLDFWPLRRSSGSGAFRVRRLILEKIPLLLLSGFSAMLTVWAQKKGAAVASLDVLPLGVRLANAVMSAVVYLVKSVWPVKLAGYYPHPADSWPAWQVAGSGLLLLSITYLAIRYAKRLPYLTFGWFWYLITLLPVIGIVQVGMQGRADRYTYVPLIGIFVIIAWGVPELWIRFFGDRRSAVLGAASCAVLAAFSVCAYVQVGYWQNSYTFYGRAVAVTQRNWFALNGLGSALMERNKPDEALECFREAVEIMPAYSAAQNNLGRALAESGDTEGAAQHYEEAVRVDPDNATAYNNLANSLLRRGRVDEAIENYRKSLRIDPDSALTQFNLALTLHQNGRPDEAARHYQASLRIDPENADAHNNLGLILMQEGKLREAIGHFDKALEINPGLRAAEDNLRSAKTLIQSR